MQKPIEHYISEIAGNMVAQIATLKKSVDDLLEQNAVLVTEIQSRDVTIESLKQTAKDKE